MYFQYRLVQPVFVNLGCYCYFSIPDRIFLRQFLLILGYISALIDTMHSFSVFETATPKKYNPTQIRIFNNEYIVN